MNAHGGFIPATPAPMDALPPGQVMQDHRTEFNGGKKGDRHCTLIHFISFLSHTLIKKFKRAPFSHRKKYNFRIQRRFDTKKIQNRLELFL